MKPSFAAKSGIHERRQDPVIFRPRTLTSLLDCYTTVLTWHSTRVSYKSQSVSAIECEESRMRQSFLLPGTTVSPLVSVLDTTVDFRPFVFMRYNLCYSLTRDQVEYAPVSNSGSNALCSQSTKYLFLVVFSLFTMICVFSSC